MNQPVRRHVFYGLSMHFPRCRLCISPRDWCALRLVGSSVKIIWVKAGEPFAGCDLFVYCNLIFFHKNPRRNWLGQYPECIQQISRKGQEGLDVLHLYNQRGDDFLCPQRCHVLPKCAVPLEPEEGNNKCWTRRHVVGFTNDTAVGVESTMWCRFHGSQATAFDSARIVWHEHVLLSSFTQAGKRESVTLLFQGSVLY